MLANSQWLVVVCPPTSLWPPQTTSDTISLDPKNTFFTHSFKSVSDPKAAYGTVWAGRYTSVHDVFHQVLNVTAFLRDKTLPLQSSTETPPIHHICRGRRGHCPWSKIVHVEQFCFTWKLLMVMWNKNFTSQANLLHMTKLFVMWSNFVMWIYYKLFPVPNFAPHDKFTMYAVLTWFTLFRRKIHFVAIYVLLCGAKINPKILSVEQKLQIWCMRQSWP